MERTFDDPQFTLSPVPARWKVKIGAVCTQCGSEMDFGRTQNGAAIIKCPQCNLGGEFSGISHESIADAVLERVMVRTGYGQ